MGNKPYFSILIPVYNQTGGKMDKCMDSLKNQTFDDYEVIFVDDGSNDGSYEMLSGFAREDTHYRIYRHEKNSSLLAARFTGMEHASGDHIVFLDSDDYLSVDALEKLHLAFEKNDADVIRFGLVREPSGTVILPYRTEDPLQAVFEGIIPPAIWKNAYSARVTGQVIQKARPFYCNMGEDTFMGCTLFSCARSFDVIDDILYHYLDGGMSSQSTSMSMEKFHKALNDVRLSGDNLIAFMDTNYPGLKEGAHKAARRMIRFVLYQYVIGEPDEEKAKAFIEEFNSEEDMDVYRFGYDRVLAQRERVLKGEKADFDFRLI